MISNYFVSDEFRRRHHQNVFDAFGVRERFGRAHVNQMAIARFLNLKQAITFAGADHAHANRDMKTFTQVFAQFFSEFSRARGNKINVLTHARLTYVCVNSLRAKHNYVVAPAQEFKHGIMDGREGKLFAHGKLLKCKSSGIEHGPMIRPQKDYSKIIVWIARGRFLSIRFMLKPNKFARMISRGIGELK